MDIRRSKANYIIIYNLFINTGSSTTFINERLLLKDIKSYNTSLIIVRVIIGKRIIDKVI